MKMMVIISDPIDRAVSPRSNNNATTLYLHKYLVLYSRVYITMAT
jgi:hypothetical protein